jgi:hypothetical protein
MTVTACVIRGLQADVEAGRDGVLLDLGQRHPLPVQRVGHGDGRLTPVAATAAMSSGLPKPPLAVTGTVDRVADLLHQRDVEALARAFLVDRGQQDFAHAARDRFLHPLDHVAAGALAAVVGVGLPLAGRDALGLDASTMHCEP